MSWSLLPVIASTDDCLGRIFFYETFASFMRKKSVQALCKPRSTCERGWTNNYQSETITSLIFYIFIHDQKLVNRGGFFASCCITFIPSVYIINPKCKSWFFLPLFSCLFYSFEWNHRSLSKPIWEWWFCGGDGGWWSGRIKKETTRTQKRKECYREKEWAGTSIVERCLSVCVSVCLIVGGYWRCVKWLCKILYCEHTYNIVFYVFYTNWGGNQHSEVRTEGNQQVSRSK